MIIVIRLLCALALFAALFLPATSVADDDDDDERRASAGRVTVSEIGQDSARVAATPTLGEGTTAYWFEYGPAPGLGTQTPAASATDHDHGGHHDDDEQRVQVAQTLTGLPAGTLHNVRLVVDGRGERDSGQLATFTTATATTAPSEPAQPADDAPQPAPGPALGASFVASAERGIVRVRPPGADSFVDLPQAASMPVGTIVDARKGTIGLRTALPGGGEQAGSFRGARFKVAQPVRARGRTDLRLRGGGFAACRRTARSARALASVARTPPRKARRLWGKDHGGRFRTHGRDSVATVRGTEWSVTDRCDGTVVAVTAGAVVVKVRRTGRVVRVRAGERHFASRRR